MVFSSYPPEADVRASVDTDPELILSQLYAFKVVRVADYALFVDESDVRGFGKVIRVMRYGGDDDFECAIDAQCVRAALDGIKTGHFNPEFLT